MKEVFLLPTPAETLFLPQTKPTEKRSVLQDGLSFRKVLEQAKSAPEKPFVKGADRHSDPIQHNDAKALEEREAVEPPIENQDRSSEKDAVDSLAQPAVAEAANVVAVEPPSSLQPDGDETTQLQEEAAGRGLEGIAGNLQESANDLSLIDSLSQDGQQVVQKQNAATEQRFAQLIQGEAYAPVLEDTEQDEKVAGQPKGLVTPEAQTSVEQTSEKAGLRSVIHPEKTGGESTQYTPSTVREKAWGEHAELAQERVVAKSVVVEGSKVGDSEAQPAPIKEGAQPEIVQSSGPPPSAVTAKPIEPARLAEAHRPEIVQQVARELEIFGKSGQTSLRIQLYPEQLGHIDVRLVSKSDGVQIVIHADQASTAFLLQRDLNFLRESLVQAGVNLSGLTVGHGQPQTGSDLSQSQFYPPNPRDGRFGEAERHGEPSPKSVLQGWRDSSSTLDYRV